jgi:hypothetical protein
VFGVRISPSGYSIPAHVVYDFQKETWGGKNAALSHDLCQNATNQRADVGAVSRCSHAVPEATTCLAVSHTAPLPFGSPFAGCPSEAQISYSTLLVQLHVPTVLDLYPAAQLLPAVSQRSKRRLHRHHNFKHDNLTVKDWAD